MTYCALKWMYSNMNFIHVRLYVCICHTISLIHDADNLVNLFAYEWNGFTVKSDWKDFERSQFLHSACWPIFFDLLWPLSSVHRTSYFCISISSRSHNTRTLFWPYSKILRNCQPFSSETNVNMFPIEWQWSLAPHYRTTNISVEKVEVFLIRSVSIKFSFDLIA